MTMVNPADRNLWIIAALVIIAVAVLAWFLNSGMVNPAGDLADVSVEAPPGAAGADGGGLAGVMRDAPASPAAPAAGGN